MGFQVYPKTFFEASKMHCPNPYHLEPLYYTKPRFMPQTQGNLEERSTASLPDGMKRFKKE